MTNGLFFQTIQYSSFSCELRKFKLSHPLDYTGSAAVLSGHHVMLSSWEWEAAAAGGCLGVIWPSSDWKGWGAPIWRLKYVAGSVEAAGGRVGREEWPADSFMGCSGIY